MLSKGFVVAVCAFLLCTTASAADAPNSPEGGGMQAGECAQKQAKQSHKGCGGKHGGKHGGHHGKGHGHAMRHANPMPNLMKIVKKHGDKLELSEEQTQQLADWRTNHMAQMHARVETVANLEGKLSESAMAGRPKAELMGIASRIMNERTQIIATKADCRDNLRRVLTQDQYEQLLALYQNR